MSFLREFSGLGSRPYPLDRERRKRVLVALAERDMSISCLARCLDVSKQYISSIISGRRLSVRTEQRIAEYLDMPVNYLFPPRTAEEIGKMREAEKKEKAA